jgi:hypothetical protein
MSYKLSTTPVPKKYAMFVPMINYYTKEILCLCVYLVWFFNRWPGQFISTKYNRDSYVRTCVRTRWLQVVPILPLDVTANGSLAGILLCYS